MAEAFLMGQGGGGLKDLVGTITYTGTYASATYFTQAGCRAGFNAAGDFFLTVQGGTSTSYENVYFTAVSLPGGVSLVGQGGYRYSSEATQQYYTAVFTGLTGKVDISIDFSAVNSTYDYVTASITMTYA